MEKVAAVFVFSSNADLK